MGRVVGERELHRHVHEDAAVVLVAGEQLRHHVGDGQELPARRVAAVAAQQLPEGLLPPLVVPAQDLEHQVVLALEVIVEGRLRDADLVEDPVEADGVKALEVEELVRRLDEPLSRRRGHHGQVYSKSR